MSNKTINKLITKIKTKLNKKDDYLIEEYKFSNEEIENLKERNKRIERTEEIHQERNGYYGVPKTWEKHIDTISADELLKGTNPNFKSLSIK